MWLTKKLRGLQERPYKDRLKMMWIAIGVAIAVLLVLWFVTLRYRNISTAELRAKISPLWNNIKQVKQAIDEKR